MTKEWLKDAAERVLATYLEAFCGLLIASSAGMMSLSSVRAAALAAIPAALSVLKSIAASRLPGTVSPASVVRQLSPDPATLPTHEF